MKLAYAGSFDPFTNGHLHIVQKALALDPNIEIQIIVANNGNKKNHFTADARATMILEATRDPRVSVSVNGNAYYAVDFARKNGCSAMLRGIRSEPDFQDECGLYQANKLINPNMETIYVMPDINLSAVRSSAVMGMVGPKGWTFAVEKLVPANIMNMICKLHSIRECHLDSIEVARQLSKSTMFNEYDILPYHNWKHIAYCLAELSVYTPSAYDNMGVVFHDTVDPDKPDDLATALSWSSELIQATPHCLEILEATNHKAPPLQPTRIQKLIHDIDLSVLAWDEERYDQYAKLIEEEYVQFKKVDLFDFRAGRLKFINSMLKQKEIFITTHYNEQKARMNLARERRGLT